MPQPGRRRALYGVCIVGLCLAGGAARAEDSTMFGEGVAQHAFAAIHDKIGHDLRVVSLRITADELSVGVPNEDAPGEVQTWRVSHKGLGALGVDLPVLEGSARASLPGGGTIAESVVAMDADSLAIVPKIVAAALARARFQAPGHATDMELMRLPKFLGPANRDPYWQLHVEAPEEDADISAKLTGELKNADLNRTRRAENLDLLAAGPDFDEMVQNIRHDVKEDWIFHYIEIEKTNINFDVHLASSKDARITRFTASLSDIKTNNLAMPHMPFPGTPTDDPFNLGDVDLSVMAKLEASAKERLGIADGAVQRVIVSKPHRERAGAIEWEVQVRSASAPIFTIPGAPPVPEGSVTFDAKGNVLHEKLPPGRGAPTNLFDPESLQKAIDKIVERLGPHVLLSELLIDDKTIKITAQDAQDPKKFAAFTYQDGDVARDADMMQTMANSFGGGQDWLWDVALLKPALVQSLGGLEKQTLASLGIAHGAIERITISKDKMFHPGNNQVLMEIRANGDGKENEWVTFDLTGAVAKLDKGANGIFVGAPGGGQSADSQDEEDCTHSEDPAKVIPACTRMAQDVNDTPHNRSVAYYDRGNAYKSRKDYDHALADYTEALNLDAQNAHAYLNRGWIYAAKNDPAHSIADSTKAIELDPSEPLAYLNRGIAYRFQRNYAASIADYNEAFKLGANAAHSYVDRGLAYAGNNEFDKALADYNEALKRGPADAPTLWARGEAYRGLDKFDLAIADYDAALKRDSNYVSAYVSRGWAYRLKNDHDRAIADYNEAIKRNPKWSAIYYDRALSYRAKGDLDHAIADATQAIQLEPKWASPYYLRGLTYFLAGATPKALADMNQVNALDPTAAYAALMLEVIGQRSKLPSRLGELSAKLDMTVWPAPVVRLYLKQSNVEALIAAADAPDAPTKQGRLCEANFYAGEMALLDGRKGDATPLLTKAASDCPATFDERLLAAAEIKAQGKH
jgi:tetratricopeptide (TPR) repeat protein